MSNYCLHQVRNSIDRQNCLDSFYNLLLSPIDSEETMFNIFYANECRKNGNFSLKFKIVSIILYQVSEKSIHRH